jgi:hypothetical protein
MFQLYPASRQTFINAPNCVLEDRVLHSTVHNRNVFCDGHFCVFFVQQSSGAQRLFDHSANVNFNSPVAVSPNAPELHIDSQCVRIRARCLVVLESVLSLGATTCLVSTLQAQPQANIYLYQNNPH